MRTNDADILPTTIYRRTRKNIKCVGDVNLARMKKTYEIRVKYGLDNRMNEIRKKSFLEIKYGKILIELIFIKFRKLNVAIERSKEGLDGYIQPIKIQLFGCP